MNSELEQALLMSPALSRMGEAVIKDMVNVSRIAEFEKGMEVVHRGDTDGAVYFLVSGEVNVSGISGGDLVLHPGAVFGEMAALFDIPQGVTITAETPVKLARFSHDALGDLLEGNENLLDVLLQLDALRS